ncbi:hypothetical protein DFS34DRAFT_596028 [Phlyctochytrium arcticum]|nr:hypothetical protein DFS34DRAFT_596028 [Phlyctochytrium arcticum]
MSNVALSGSGLVSTSLPGPNNRPIPTRSKSLVGTSPNTKPLPQAPTNPSPSKATASASEQQQQAAENGNLQPSHSQRQPGSATDSLPSIGARAGGSGLEKGFGDPTFPKEGASGDSTGSLQPLLAQALARAELAVRLDAESKYVEALQAYCDTILIFEIALEKADEAQLSVQLRSRIGRASQSSLAHQSNVLLKEDRKRLIELRNTYVQRVGVLLSTLPAEYTAWYNSRATTRSAAPLDRSRSASISYSRNKRLSHSSHTPSTPIEPPVDDPTMAETAEPPPSNPDLRVFWLMRLLSKSMTSGGYVTNGLFVPRQVWSQPGARFVAFESKMAACNDVMRELDALELVSGNETDKLGRQLEQVLRVMDQAKKNLAKKLRFIQDRFSDSKWKGSSTLFPDSTNTSLSTASSNTSLTQTFNTDPARMSNPTPSRFASWGNKISKSVEKLTKDRSPDSAVYTETILRFFTAALRLEKVCLYYEGLPPVRGVPLVSARLQLCSKLLTGVFCLFIIKDLEALLERFLRKGRPVTI